MREIPSLPPSHHISDGCVIEPKAHIQLIQITSSSLNVPRLPQSEGGWQRRRGGGGGGGGGEGVRG